MATSSDEPNDALRQAIADAYRADSAPLALSVSAEAGALHHHLTGRPLGYPAEGETVADLERHRLAVLAGEIIAHLLEDLADTEDARDGAHLEAAAEALVAHPRLTDKGRDILTVLAGAIGPALAGALPHLFEGRPDAG